LGHKRQKRRRSFGHEKAREGTKKGKKRFGIFVSSRAFLWLISVGKVRIGFERKTGLIRGAGLSTFSPPESDA